MWTRARGTQLVAAAAGLAITASACGGGGGTAAEGAEGVVSIGVIYPMSGPNAFVAEEMLNGLQIAIDKHNETSAGAPEIKLLIEDDQSTANTGVSAFQKLVDRDQVSAIVGPFNSDVAAAVAPLAETEGVPLIATGATATHLIEADRKTFYRANSGNGLQAVLTMQYVTEELGWERVGFIYQETDWGEDLRNISRTELEERGGTVAFDIAYPPGTTNFMTTATKIGGQDYDGIVVAALGGEAAPLVRQLTQAGVEAERIAGYSIDPDQMLENAGAEAIAGMYMSTPFDPWNDEFTNEVSKAFIEEYEGRHNSKPTLYAAQGNLAGKLIAQAVTIAGGGDRQAIMDALDENRPIESVYGKITLTENQDVEPPLLIQQFQADGTPVTIGRVSED